MPGVVTSGVPVGLPSCEGGRESPDGAIVKVGGWFGWLATGPDESDTEDGCVDIGPEEAEGSDVETAADLGSSYAFGTEVGGGSCGGEPCGVMVTASWASLLE